MQVYGLSRVLCITPVEKMHNQDNGIFEGAPMGMRRHSRPHAEMNKAQYPDRSRPKDFSLFEPKSYLDPATRHRREAVVNELRNRFDVSGAILYQKHLPATTRFEIFKENVLDRWNEVLTTPYPHRQIGLDDKREFSNLAMQLGIDLDSRKIK